jgi:hypothetical protein
MGRDFRRRSVHDGRGYCCPEGRDCNVCADRRTCSRRNAERKAVAQMQEYASA